MIPPWYDHSDFCKQRKTSDTPREREGTQDQTGVTPTFCLTGENEALSRTLHLCYCLQQMAFKCKFLPGLKEGCGLYTYIPHLNSYNLHNGVGIKMRLHNDSSHTTHHPNLKHSLPYILHVFPHSYFNHICIRHLILIILYILFLYIFQSQMTDFLSSNFAESQSYLSIYLSWMVFILSASIKKTKSTFKIP